MNYTSLILNYIEPSIQHEGRYPITLSTLSATLNMTEYSLKKELEELKRGPTLFIEKDPGGGYAEIQITHKLPDPPQFVNITSLPFTERRALTYFFINHHLKHNISFEEVTYKNCKYFLDVGENLYYKMSDRLTAAFPNTSLTLTEELFTKKCLLPIHYNVGNNIFYSEEIDKFVYGKRQNKN